MTTKVFVHGVPETAAVWDNLRALLPDPSVALALPGFGAPRPTGFTATKEVYAQWVAQQLREIGGPIDLVGHDWGALLTMRVVTAFDVPVRSWVVDVPDLLHPHAVWHPGAVTWQTPGVGERVMAERLAAAPDGPDSFGARLAKHGVPPGQATRIGAAHDDVMSDSILALYRSAVPNLWADWGAQVKPTRARGLVLLMPDEPGIEALSIEVAALLGAATERLDLDHCWMAEDPARSLEMLEGFWRSL